MNLYSKIGICLLYLLPSFIHAQSKLEAKDNPTHIETVHSIIKQAYNCWETIHKSKLLAEEAKISAMPRFIFYGPSGTSKTYTAEEIAKIFKLKNFRINCETVVNTYQNSGVETINAEFEKIVKTLETEKKPIVLVLDEIHELGIPKTHDGQRDRDAQTSAYVCLNHWLDTLQKKPVIVIATTNHIDRLAPELKRRLGRPIHFDYLDRETRKKMLIKALISCAPPFEMSYLEKIQDHFKNNFYRLTPEIKKFITKIASITQAINSLNINEYSVEKIQNIYSSLNELHKDIDRMNLILDKHNSEPRNFEKTEKKINKLRKEIIQYEKLVHAYINRYIFVYTDNFSVLLNETETDLQLLQAIALEIIQRSIAQEELNTEAIQSIIKNVKEDPKTFMDKVAAKAAEHLKFAGEEVEKGFCQALGSQLGIWFFNYVIAPRLPAPKFTTLI